jgi:hypothetical protein
MLPRHLLATLLAAAPLCAQNDFDLDKTSPATAGGSLDLAYAGAPAGTFSLLMVSFTGGPTALASFVPGDPRSVQVGTELSAMWLGHLTGANGNGSFALQLPNTTAIDDLVFHWQMATLATGGPSPVGPISNDVVTQIGMPRTGLLARGALFAARAFAAGFFDRDNNNGAGDFVLAGGGAGTLTAATGLQSTEVWDFRDMTVRAGANMNLARALHTAVRLNDGRVLLAGGADGAGAVTATCELYNPATGTYTPTANMSTPRVMHAACKLADGRVMVAGGTASLVDVITAATGSLQSVEIYSPANGTWSSGAAIGGRRLAPALALLPNNQIMISGGVQIGILFGIPISAASTTAVQRWNPTTDTWTSGPNMNTARAGHHFNQVVLANGNVLVTGGIDVPSLLNAANGVPIASAELYNGSSWTASTMPYATAMHTATALSNGKVAVCGGAQGTFAAPIAVDGAALFDPLTNGWTSLPALTTPRSGHVAALLPDGLLVLFGGADANGSLASIETLRF